jgi:flagellar biosynthesis/type III secretory pathway chaperone
MSALHREPHPLDRLVDVLERERAALVAGADDAIERLAHEKEAAAVALARICDAGPLEALPAALRARARLARDLNESNGRLIALRGRHLSARLAALAASVPSATYGPDGGARPGAPPRSFASA